MECELSIQGNEHNGYCVIRKVDGDWKQITKRYETYDEAEKALQTFDR